jgi:hypothetical protein
MRPSRMRTHLTEEQVMSRLLTFVAKDEAA